MFVFVEFLVRNVYFIFFRTCRCRDSQEFDVVLSQGILEILRVVVSCGSIQWASIVDLL